MSHQIQIYGPFRAGMLGDVELYQAVCVAGDLATFVSTREAVERAGQVHLELHQDDDPRDELLSRVRSLLGELSDQDLQLVVQLVEREQVRRRELTPLTEQR